MARNYTIDIIGRGEEYTYFSGNVELTLSRTYSDGHRLFCDGTSRNQHGLPYPIDKREGIIRNICEYFETMRHPTIFVIDDQDQDFAALVSLIEALRIEGHKLELEIDSEEQRDRARDDMYLKIIRGGKELSIDGVDIISEEEYWRWKRDT